MKNKIILIIILSLSGVLGVFSIIYAMYKVAKILESKIDPEKVIESFCTEYSWQNRWYRKLYIFIKNYKETTTDIFYSYKKRCIKYSIIIILLLILRLIIIEILEKYNDKILEFFTKMLNIFSFNISILNFNIGFNEIKWVVLTFITIIGVKKYYKDKIRKSVKEECYKEVIDEYLRVKDILLDIIIITNVENEKILYRILKCDYQELKEVSDFYKKEIFNYLDSHIFDEEYKKVEKHIRSSIPQFNKLKECKFNSKDIYRFKEFFDSRSRHTIIYSINNKLAELIWDIGIKSICILDKEHIIKSFMRSSPKSMGDTLEYKLNESINTRIEILRIIDKIDRKIGLYKKENSIYESFINKK